MDRFRRVPHPDDDTVKILSTCVLCGAKIVGSAFDETLHAREALHRRLCGYFMHTVNAEGTVVHSTCLQCRFLIQAKIDHPLQEMEAQHLQVCIKRAAAETA